MSCYFCPRQIFQIGPICHRQEYRWLPVFCLWQENQLWNPGQLYIGPDFRKFIFRYCTFVQFYSSHHGTNTNRTLENENTHTSEYQCTLGYLSQQLMSDDDDVQNIQSDVRSLSYTIAIGIVCKDQGVHPGWDSHWGIPPCCSDPPRSQGNSRRDRSDQPRAVQASCTPVDCKEQKRRIAVASSPLQSTA